MLAALSLIKLLKSLSYQIVHPRQHLHKLVVSTLYILIDKRGVTQNKYNSTWAALIVLAHHNLTRVCSDKLTDPLTLFGQKCTNLTVSFGAANFATFLKISRQNEIRSKKLSATPKVPHTAPPLFIDHMCPKG